MHNLLNTPGASHACPTGELRLAGPAALIKFITTELATQWETSQAD